jgi:NAD(P)-dependent dehydrogenase (short-subunit alcohol dehydrogenase family)
MDLTDSTVVVTGGASGIGREIAIRLAEHGADVVVADVREKPRLPEDAPVEAGARGEATRDARPTYEDIDTDTDGTGRFVECDVRDPDEIRVAVEAADSLGGVDVLVNNAGVFRTVPFTEIAEAEYDRLMAINAKGVFFGGQIAAETMDEGCIVNLSSIAALHGTGNHPVYSASKAAVRNLTASMADALGPEIRVNAVLPGVIDTAMTREDVPTVGGERAERYRDRIPLERFGDPRDVADAVLFLASDAAGYISGEGLVVDGGLSAT